MTTPAKLTLEFSHTGMLPIWVALPLCGALLVLCLFILRAEIRRLRRRGGRRWLYVTRSLVVAAFSWVLIQPILFIRTETAERGRLVLLLDDSRSMFLTDEYQDLSSRLDLAQLLRLPGISERSSVCQTYAAQLRRQESELTDFLAAVRRLSDELAEGLPWGDSFTGALDEQCRAIRAWARASEQQAAALGKLQASLDAAEEEIGHPDYAKHFSAVRSYEAACSQVAQFLSEWQDQPVRTAESLIEIQDAYGRIEGALPDAVEALRVLQAASDEQLLAEGPEEISAELARIVGMSRIQLAGQALQRSGLLAELDGQHRLDVLRLKELASLRSGEPPSLAVPEVEDAQPVTDYFGPLEALTKRHSLDLVSGIVLFSDGRPSRLDRPEVLQRLVKQRIPLVAVGVGSTDPVPDMAIADYACPRVALPGKKVVLEVALKDSVAEPVPYVVRLLAGDSELARAQGEAGDAATPRHALEFALEEPGTKTLELVVEWAGPDANPGNDRALLAIQVLPKKPKALVVGATARWDLVYLLRALERGVCLYDLALTGERKTKPSRGKGNGKIPKTLKDLKSYDVVILDGEPFRGFRDEDAGMLADYVRDAGGRLILIQSFGDAAKPSYRTILSALLPELSPAIATRRSEGGPGVLDIVEQYRALPVTLLSAESEESRGTWSQLAPPRALFPVSPQRLPIIEEKGRGVAALSLGFYGRGRVYQLGIGDLFRMREWHGSAAVDQFLSNLVEDALLPQFENVVSGLAVSLYPSLPSVGRKSWLLAYSAGDQPSEVSASVQYGEGAREVRLSSLHEGGWKLKGAEIVPPRPGPFSISVSSAGATGKLEAHAAQPLSKESIYFDLDESALKRMAEEAEGAYVHLAGLEGALRAVPPKTRPQVSVREVKLWNLKIVLLLIAALLTADWVLRRKMGIIF